MTTTTTPRRPRRSVRSVHPVAGGATNEDRERAGSRPAGEIDDGWRAVLDRLVSEARLEVADGWEPIEASRSVLARHPVLEVDLLRHLAAYGLARHVHVDLATRRERAARPAAAGFVVLLPNEPPAEDPLAIPALRADGTMAAYAEWSRDDWRAWETFCERQAEGWFTRQEGAGAIAKLLEKHRAGKTGDLPPAALERVRATVRGFRA